MQGKNKVISNNNKKTRKIDNPKDYEDSGIKDTMEDLENKAKSALHSAPEITREQLPNSKETTKEILYGGGNNNDTTSSNNKNENKKKLVS